MPYRCRLNGHAYVRLAARHVPGHALMERSLILKALHNAQCESRERAGRHYKSRWKSRPLRKGRWGEQACC